MIRTLIVLLVLTTTLSQALGQENEKSKTKILIFPVFFYTPETNFGLGMTSIFYFREQDADSSKTSSIPSAFIYTFEDQIIISNPFDIFLKDGKYRLKGELGFFKYPYQFYGIGPDVSLDKFENYSATFLRFNSLFLKKFNENSYTGPAISYDEYFDVSIEDGGLLDSNKPTGIETGRLIGVGAGLIVDHRDNQFSPSNGTYLESRYIRYINLIGDYGFHDFYVDGRKYFEVRNDMVLATQVFHQTVLGNAPFYNLALLGGSSKMRGYYRGAYRDNHFTCFQFDMRKYIFKRFLIAGFGGIGAVGSRADDYKNILPSAGIGLRYEIDPKERIRIRVDYAFGKNTSGFYININEAF
ncbi:MAG: BamA/TamA family outer membrane protein [Cyclobacteriaceae bacterium]